MTPEEIDAEVARIAAAVHDDEAAHSMEDALYVLVLREIADDNVHDAQECARRALKAREILFARWCA